jgi:hypothetical protein
VAVSVENIELSPKKCLILPSSTQKNDFNFGQVQKKILTINMNSIVIPQSTIVCLGSGFEKSSVLVQFFDFFAKIFWKPSKHTEMYTKN